MFIGRPDWHDQAECADADINLFFPRMEGNGATRLTAQAKEYCCRCPVRQQCFEYAMTFADQALKGVWGGTTERERRKMRHYATPITYSANIDLTRR